ncbi:dihydropteroate synthase [Spirobacillus cienkowskii]|jgi:dihydropteroate synthase|uniref:dihydropteroate synthase n=1 Tax=Spirobacillus cienkowskii TaxID=495820 RepID=A0A369L188_9BACT|nr:MAG: dihydropteroate synthase [Spirobacillus cienkowskii]
MCLTGAEKFKEICEDKQPVWMGIVNLTPDSFSDGGKFNTKQNAIQKAISLVKHGAHIIDFGGVSTRPFSQCIEPKIELERVYDIIKSVRNILPSKVLISIDSFSPIVMNELAKDSLIDIINDQFSSRRVENIEIENITKNRNAAQVAAYYDLGYIIMHMQGIPKTMQLDPQYYNCSQQVYDFLLERMQYVQSEGVKFLALDPGIGFGKSLEHNIELLSEPFIKKLTNLNAPILIGVSRKSFIGMVHQELNNPLLRDEMSKKYEMQSIASGAKIIRTHVMPEELGLT